MAIKTFNLPDPGEGLTEAEIVSWRVAPGDTVKVNDIVVEIETSKSLVELPIPWDGTVAELLAPEGTEVEVGAPIIAIEVAEEETRREPNLVGYGAISAPTTRRARKSVGAAQQSAAAPVAPAASAAPGARSAVDEAPPRPLAKPPVRKYAKDRGVDLVAVPPAGAQGTVTREDIDAFLADGAVAPGGVLAGTVPGMAAQSSLSTSTGERETRVPIKGVRKATAAAMVGSAFTAPHVTEFVTIDVSAAMELVERLKSDREFDGVKVSPLLVVAKALLVACRRNPGVNAVWDDAAQEIVQKHYVNLGIAAATPRGLVVPNIKDADTLTTRQLAGALDSLIATAREGRTSPADMSGGTMTITNVGVFGVDAGTPIINPGESAILALGSIRRKPWVVTDAAGDESIEPRWVTTLGLSFDHRLIDGDLGSRFLADIAAILHDPTRGFVWS